MNDYDKEYPEFNLKEHKGYPSRADHREAVSGLTDSSTNLCAVEKYEI